MNDRWLTKQPVVQQNCFYGSLSLAAVTSVHVSLEQHCKMTTESETQN